MWASRHCLGTLKMLEPGQQAKEEVGPTGQLKLMAAVSKAIVATVLHTKGETYIATWHDCTWKGIFKSDRPTEAKASQVCALVSLSIQQKGTACVPTGPATSCNHEL